MSEPRKSIADLIGPVRPALDALRFFTATTRGFRDKEQAKLAAFLKELCPLGTYSDEEVKDWLKTKAGFIDTHDYRSGKTSEYLALLRAIPSSLLARTKDYAVLIAGGSGRKPMNEELRHRIEVEFCENPFVVPPPPMDSGELGVRVSMFGVERL